MIVCDILFGFEIEQKNFNWPTQRPQPPKDFIPFNHKKAHCQAGKCPNCGHEKPGISYNGGGFQDREIQNLDKALERKNHRLPADHPNWKPDYESFSIDLDPDRPEHDSMLKSHPSRHSTGYFCCCKARIWHDFYSEDGKGWAHYYKPTAKNNNTLQQWC